MGDCIFVWYHAMSECLCYFNPPWCKFGEWKTQSSFQYHKIPQISMKTNVHTCKNKKQQKNINSEILTEWCTSHIRQQRVLAYFLSTQSCIPIAKLLNHIEVLYTTTMQVKPSKTRSSNTENMTCIGFYLRT